MPVAQGEAYWASVHAPNTTFEERWTIDLFVDEDTAKKLKADGLNSKEVKLTKAGKVSHPGKEVGDEYFNFKRKTKYPDGNPLTPPRVVDAKKNPVGPQTLIGNGSEVNVAFRIREWAVGGNSGVTADLTGVQVLNLVEYEEEDDAFEEADGFTATAPKQEDDPFAA